MDPVKTYNYALIGNCTSAALVGTDCSIDWLCLPFFDSPSTFARILDKDKGGHFRITGIKEKMCEQEYLYHTPILKTVFTTEEGVLEVRDYMPRFIQPGDDVYCPPEIHRNIRVVAGNPRIRIELKPRPNYGLGDARFYKEEDCIKFTSVDGKYNSYYLYTNLDFDAVLNGDEIRLKDSAYFLLSYHAKIRKVESQKIYVEYEKTKSYWLDWIYRTQVPPVYKEEVIRSSITLKLLMFQRTGAVIAAPTTSLPEIIGGERNWDYRNCWVRDASMIIELFSRMGHVHTAERFIGFILNRMLLKHEDIGVVYGINGEKVLEEKILEHLSGYENSYPVRIGNDAYRQKQNDIYGQLFDAIYTAFFSTGVHQGFNDEIWTVVRTLANRVIEIWREPDCGIWERRDGLKHHVHSKLMSWVAMDRAARIAAAIGKKQYALKYAQVATLIKEDIVSNGYDKEMRSYVMSYGSKDLDAANLLMIQYGFLPVTDFTIKSTVKRSYDALMKNGFMMRYNADDGFGLPKNAFLVCSFWMANALYMTGAQKQAHEIFDWNIRNVNRFGLLAEDIEPDTLRLTGNFPQGYSHLALIQTAFLFGNPQNVPKSDLEDWLI